MKLLFAAFAALALVVPASALTPAEAEARAALALSAAKAPAKSKAGCTGDCPCDDLFGKCFCEPGKCPCCAKSKGAQKTATGAVTKAPCVCGDACKCEAGKCEAGPTERPTTLPPVAEPETELRLINGTFYRVPKGQKPAALSAPVPFAGVTVGGCANGSCGTGR